MRTASNLLHTARRIGLAAAGGLVCALALSAQAADFAVYPLRVFFAPGERSAAVGVNNTGGQPIRFQLSLVEWTQDAAGKDVYTESEELIFFPRLFTVQAGEQGVVRIGPKRAYAGKERTFRVFVDELPDDSAKPAASGITFSIRFAIPVFMGTLGTKAQGVIEPLALKDGKLLAAVRNDGSAHFRIESMEIVSDKGYSHKTDGWYLLAGARRLHTLDLPREACLAAHRLELRVKTIDGGDGYLNATIDVDPAQCGS